MISGVPHYLALALHWGFAIAALAFVAFTLICASPIYLFVVLPAEVGHWSRRRWAA